MFHWTLISPIVHFPFFFAGSHAAKVREFGKLFPTKAPLLEGTSMHCPALFLWGCSYRFHPQTLMGQAPVVPKKRLGIDNSRRNPQALYWEKPQLAKIYKFHFSGIYQDIPIRCGKPLHETPEIWTWKHGPHLGILQTSSTMWGPIVTSWFITH